MVLKTMFAAEFAIINHKIKELQKENAKLKTELAAKETICRACLFYIRKIFDRVRSA